MSSYGWNEAPAYTRKQVETLVTSITDLPNVNPTDVYLHGSLAMGCFNPRRSDIDLLVVTAHPLSIEAKRSLIELLLRISRSPHPVEISFLQRDDLFPWQYPTPFDLHYSEDWREQYSRDLQGDDWRRWNDIRHRDPDLAAHITIARARGICLLGMPPATALPPVPPKDYLDSIISDLEWAHERAAKFPTYGILNACRVLAYLREGHIYSKVEGGEWGLAALPPAFHPAIRSALAAYRDDSEIEMPPVTDAERLLAYALTECRSPR